MKQLNINRFIGLDNYSSEDSMDIDSIIDDEIIELNTETLLNNDSDEINNIYPIETLLDKPSNSFEYLENNNIWKKNDKVKRVLCFSILSNESCHFGNKCLFAHKLEEQRIEPIRKLVYEVLQGTRRMDNIDLVNNNELYSILLQLTKVCSSCIRKTCPGGYNCKNGVLDTNYQICYDNLVNDSCKFNFCHQLHLTKIGLVAYEKQLNQYKKPELEPNVNIGVWNDPPKSIRIPSNQKVKKYRLVSKKHDKSLNNIKGTLLTPLSVSQLNRKYIKNTNHEISDSSESEIEMKRNMEYLNTYSDSGSDDESIFIE
jgi:hypothetical protein